MRIHGIILSFILALTGTYASSATLIVSNGQLLGAKGVTIAGARYNVDFLDGRCVDLFAPCTSNADFAFSNGIEARRAARALLRQVFINGPDGPFDNRPGLTNGCGRPSVCAALVPFRVSPRGAVRVRAATNTPLIDFIEPLTISQLAPLNSPLATYAVFTQAIPVPGSFVFLATVLGGGAIFGRRRSQACRDASSASIS